MLKNNEKDSTIIQELKLLLNENLDKRFPVEPLHICAFLLDPSQLKINIDRYLAQIQSTKESVLIQMIEQFKMNSVPSVATTQKTSVTATSSSRSVTATTTTLSPLLKRNLSVECLKMPSQNLKKIREDLIQKHTTVPDSSADPVTTETNKYLNLDVNCDDVLEFWRSSNDAYPHLKRLAQVILAIPATSSPSEQVFSITGLILNAKRTMLSPNNVGKIQMIHDNYNLLKKT